MSHHTDTLPNNAPAFGIDVSMARTAVEIAAERHAGTVEQGYKPQKQSELVERPFRVQSKDKPILLQNKGRAIHVLLPNPFVLTFLTEYENDSTNWKKKSAFNHLKGSQGLKMALRL